MEVGAQIKKYRSNMGISQEELAEKVYVSRQTVSNWETGKNYPDIHSVLLLSSVFNVSLDQLIKGDVEIMKKEIKETEIKKLNKYGGIYAVSLILAVISLVPFIVLMDWYGLIPWSVVYAIAGYFAFKTEKVKKENNISTYKEIVAFTEGKRLDEIEEQQENGKRPYQIILLMLGSAAIAFIVVYLMAKLFSL
ncbi:XRE family transcriptional regulator [Petralouisia muris]|uniref:XRE family transcriptional regulator n=1 Tax=Petralouisia muris TaxID=3032872 RepID=A0AC61RPV7_9FIRM|nr:helix-turn-helix transcriptional regulator [Petralouisia muris]TGY89537.1 XRE family transcriptional regulator [Petralouisia muris]